MKEIFDLLRKEVSEHVDPASQIYSHEPVVTLRDVNQILDLAQCLWEKKQVKPGPAVNSDNIPDGYYYIKDSEVFHEDGYSGTSEQIGSVLTKEKMQMLYESIIDEFVEELKKVGVRGSFEYTPDKDRPWSKEHKYCKMVGTKKIEEVAARIKAQKFNEAQLGVDSDFSDEIREMLMPPQRDL